MFNPKVIARFFGKLLAALLLILCLAFFLDLATELYHREDDWVVLTTSWPFWLAVLRNFVPSVVAIVAVYVLAARFLQTVYSLETFAEARSFLDRCLFGPRSFRPWLKFAEGTLEGDADHILMRAGGPGRLVVNNDTAVLLERGGLFTQVQTSSLPQLERFEKPYHVIDLRPGRQVYKVDALSKEGIPVVCEADISYQIDNEGLPSTEEQPFPAPEKKIFMAATCTWIREPNRSRETRKMDWIGRILVSETEGSLRTILARYSLDGLIGLTSSETQDTREEIRQALETTLKAAVPKLGARVTKVDLGDIRVGEEISEQWIKAWQARWANWATERQAMGKAKQVEQLERAKTAAQVMMINAITSAFQPMAVQDQDLSSRLILARLFMVLGRTSTEPWTRVFLPPEAMNTLKILQDMTKD